jgi:hypothetical protein
LGKQLIVCCLEQNQKVHLKWFCSLFFLKNTMIKFDKTYFILFLALFVLEVFIANYATGFIRHTVGDYFAAMLVYTFLKSIFKIAVQKAALSAFVISFVIEFLQLSNLQNSFPEAYEKTLKIILGTSFSIGDLIAYTFGIISIVFIEKKTSPFKLKNDIKEFIKFLKSFK